MSGTKQPNSFKEVIGGIIGGFLAIFLLVSGIACLAYFVPLLDGLFSAAFDLGARHSKELERVLLK